MSCTNCFNGCAEIVSDQCVKYTGVDVPLLGIQHGDTLATVENAIISFVTPFLDGSGIKPIIDPDIICDVVRQYITTCVECNGFNLNDILTAIIKAVCDLQIQINDVVADVATIEADYEVGCIEEVSASAGTHDILQAVINTLCQVQADLATLSLDLSTNYVRADQINNFISTYISDNTSNLVNAKMIPFVALEFYGTLVGKFDFTGKGIGAWKDINLCNGDNGTPDKRGRVAVCAIQDMGGGILDSEVDPSDPSGYNPNYVIDVPDGSNFMALSQLQIPDHTHIADVIVDFNDPGHDHQFEGVTNSSGSGTGSRKSVPITRTTTKNETGITVDVTVTNRGAGGGLPHPNVQPVYPCYYIMYIPT